MKHINILVFLVLALFLFSCSEDNTTNNTDTAIAKGFIVYDGDRPIFTYFDGKTQDTFFLNVFGYSDDYRIVFLDKDSSKISEETLKEIILGWSITDPTALGIQATPNKTWSFFLATYRITNTKFRLFLLKGNKNLFQSDNLPVVIQNTALYHSEAIGLKVRLGSTDSLVAEAHLKPNENTRNVIKIKSGVTIDFYKLWFFDAKNRPFQYSNMTQFKMSVSDTTIAEYVPIENQYWNFQLKGKTPGTAYLTCKIWKNLEFFDEYSPLKIIVE